MCLIIHDFTELGTFYQISYNEFKPKREYVGGCVKVTEKLKEILEAIYAAEDSSTKKIKKAKEKSQHKIERLMEELKAEREEYVKTLERRLKEIIEKRKKEAEEDSKKIEVKYKEEYDRILSLRDIIPQKLEILEKIVEKIIEYLES